MQFTSRSGLVWDATSVDTSYGNMSGSEVQLSLTPHTNNSYPTIVLLRYLTTMSSMVYISNTNLSYIPNLMEFVSDLNCADLAIEFDTLPRTNSEMPPYLILHSTIHIVDLGKYIQRYVTTDWSPNYSISDPLRIIECNSSDILVPIRQDPTINVHELSITTV